MSNSKRLVRFDWAMKNILRDKSNFDILEGFLSELLHEQINIDKLLESEGNQNSSDDKFNRVDLLAHTDAGEKIIVEVQSASEWDFYHRILFGTSKVITEYIKTGDPYSKVPKVISVSILHFNLGDGEDYIYKGITEFIGLHKEDKLNLSDRSTKLYIEEIGQNYKSISDIFPTYYLIQLPKFTGVVRDKFDQWVYFLNNEQIENSFDAQGIQSAQEKLDVLKLSEPDRIAYNKYWENISFEASLAQTHHVELAYATKEARLEGEQIGLQKGKIEGEKEAKIAIAKQLKAMGMDNNQIAKATELSMEEINRL